MQAPTQETQGKSKKNLTCKNVGEYAVCHCQKLADKNCDVTERHTASHFPHIPSSQFGHFVTKKFYDVTGRHITSHFPHIPSSQFGHFVTICDFDMLLQILIVNIKKYFFITCLTILERIMSEKVHSRVRQANVTLWRRCDSRIVDGVNYPEKI